MILLMIQVMNSEGPEGEDLEYDTVNDTGNKQRGARGRTWSMILLMIQVMNREEPEGEDLEYDTVNDTGNEQRGARGGGLGV